jgi:Secretion system C-terminal sorting domain
MAVLQMLDAIALHYFIKGETMKNFQLLRTTSHVFFLMLIAVIIHGGDITAQTTPQPTSPSGTNSVVFNASTNEYCFRLNTDTLYWYRIGNDTTNWGGSGGVLISLRARTYDGQTGFIPSQTGGPIIDSCGTDMFTFQAKISLISSDRVGDTVVTSWKMRYGDNLWFSYQYKLYISGRTLVLRATALGGSNGIDMASGFLLDKCENYNCQNSVSPYVIHVPYLTLFNLAYSNQSFTSVFFDWEKTNCSQYTPEPWPETIVGDSYGVRFAPRVAYLKKTNNHRNPLNETIYITVSPDLNGALPNLPGPTAPYRVESMNRTVLSYGPPFPWLLYPNPCYSYKLLDSIKHLGVNNIAVIIKNWQYGQFDHKYPAVLPPNNFDNFVCDGTPAGGNGGMSNLQTLIKHVKDTLHYDIAVHENYTDYYTDAFSPFSGSYGYSELNEAKQSNGTYVTGYLSSCDEGPAHIIKPSTVGSFVSYWSGLIKNDVNPNWSYLDVHSAVNPSNYVDYDTSTNGAGLFRFVLQQYRLLPSLLRSSYLGPVEGEGWNHFLYIGYYDDFEAGIHTADANIFGYKAPLLVDFDLLKMHGRSALHGPGHCFAFVPGKVWMDPDTLQMYIATELAYGHAGLITKCNIIDHTFQQAILEYNHVLPMQQAYMNASPISIQYSDGSNFYSASDYIASHHGYWDITNTQDFMGRVKIIYDNGAVVCVNRSSSVWHVDGIGIARGWFTRNIVGVETPIAGGSSTTSFDLKAGCGWVCFNPCKPVAAISVTATPYAPTKNLYRYTWTANVSGGYAPYSYKWTQSNNSTTATTSSISEIINTTNPSFTLTLEVTDKNGLNSTARINSNFLEIDLDERTGRNAVAVPEKYFIDQNYPNPFNPSTIINYGLPEDSFVRIDIYDMLGRCIAVLKDGMMKAGYQNVMLNASRLSSGIYFCRIKATSTNGNSTQKSFIRIKKMLLLK